MSYSTEMRDGRTVVLKVNFDPDKNTLRLEGKARAIAEMERCLDSPDAFHWHPLLGSLRGPLKRSQWEHVEAALSSWNKVYGYRHKAVITGDQPQLESEPLRTY